MDLPASLDAIVIAAFLAFCRIGACFMLMPGLSSIRVPMQIRLFTAAAVTFALLAHLWDFLVPFVSSRPDALLLLIVSEVLIGALIGLLARLYLLAVQFIGSAMGMMSGFNAMGGTAIEEPDPQGALGAIISLSVLLLLFVFDFHHEIIRALVDSYEVAPVDTLYNPASALADVTDTLSAAFLVMLRLGSPFIAYAILVNLAVGLINKLTPQIPIYFVSLPFVLAGGLILAWFAIGPFLSLAVDGFLPSTIAR
jgi:flagellar biosynthetic protein FliR